MRGSTAGLLLGAGVWCGALGAEPVSSPVGDPPAWDFSAQVSAGRAYFAGTCAVCHQHDGGGIPGVFPPISNNEFLKKSKEELILLVLTGTSGKIVVNGQQYNSTMPALSSLKDDELANVLTFVYASWGNRAVRVSPEDVAAVRAKRPRRALE